MPYHRLVGRPSLKRRVGTSTGFTFSVVVYAGLLEALLGKPGTLHSPGQIITSALGVPPDLRGASAPGRSRKDHGRVEGGWLHPRRSRWVVFVLVTRQGLVTGSIVVGDLPPTRSPCFLPYFFTSPLRGLLGTSVPPRCGQGGGAITRLVLHSTPQAATVRSRRPLVFPPCTG